MTPAPEPLSAQVTETTVRPLRRFVKSPNTPVFAVIRLDHTLADLSLSAGAALQATVLVTVKEIVTTREAAEAEVERLNKLNAEKGCRYFWQQTRFVSDDNAA